MNSTERLALVTGGGSGLGAAIATTLPSCGYHVVCAGRRSDRVQAVAGRICENGGVASAIKLDITDGYAVDRAFHELIATFGRLDLLVNNAGVFQRAKVTEIDDQGWERVLRTNLTGSFFCTRAAVREMRHQEISDGCRGHVVNINSGACLRGYAGGASYAASKFGLLGLSDSLRIESAEYGIKVTDIIVDATVESEMSNSVEERLPASVVGIIVRDVVSLPGAAVLDRVQLSQLPQPGSAVLSSLHRLGEVAGGS